MENVVIGIMLTFSTELILVFVLKIDRVNAADRVVEAYNGMHASVIIQFREMVVDIAMDDTKYLNHVIRKIVQPTQWIYVNSSA